MAASRRLAWWAAVAAGGAVGALARYEATLARPVDRGAFPWAILGVNVVGCLLAGAVMAVVVRRPDAPAWLRPLLVVGVCGGLTTFSTWMVTDVLLVRDGDTGTALLDVAVSLTLGLLAVWVGFHLAAALAPGRRVAVLDVRDAD